MKEDVIHFDKITEADRERVGGKGYVLAELRRRGLPVPDGVCLPVGAYDRYVRETGLRERIMMELNRKPLAGMRWEEIWDAAFRIRNLFTRTPLPSGQYRDLIPELEGLSFTGPVMVRSSAPGEDSGRTSYAGLHDSFVARGGAAEILEKIRLVWASLWSDRALLYRKELDLSGEESTIAVVIQRLEEGDVSGVGFGINPSNDDQAVIEAVWGLNQGLVDGTVHPDRWILDRKSGRIISHVPAERRESLVLEEGEAVLRPLDESRSARPPLSEDQIGRLAGLMAPLESFLGSPADFEWTFRGDRLFLLQSRPITTGAAPAGRDKKLWENDDQRPWYLSLSRSFDNLKNLRRTIEDELIPAMIVEADQLEAVDLNDLDDNDLADEIERRAGIRDRWRDIYWSDFIPFAHGIRLFGQVYNDAVHPDNPYEFMDLLGAAETESMARNRMLEGMAGLIREDKALGAALERGETAVSDSRFEELLRKFMEDYGRLSCGVSQCSSGRDGIVAILLRMAAVPEAARPPERSDPATLGENYLSRFPAPRREKAAAILELGRASYRLRDDDNIYLARIEGELLRAREEGRKRIEGDDESSGNAASRKRLRLLIEKINPLPEPKSGESRDAPAVSARQLVGQPASPGFARGKARLIREPADLFRVESGDILVVDAVEPEMTFAVPLSAAIVERRGGMLIHGAIIAREYGLPCVTGIPDALETIPAGSEITVDGSLGIVILN